jgi:phosphoribosylamine--glycine ligase
VRIALVSTDGSGAWFLLRLMREGNSCDYYLLEEDKSSKVLAGMVPEPKFSAPKSWKQYDLVIFDRNSDGELADEIRKQTYVIGCSELSCRLEDDRLFGLETMEQMGISVPAYEAFDSPESARRFLSENPDRYVFKPFQEPGGEDLDCLTTYVSHSAADMENSLDRLFKASKGASFILQKFVEGIEISTEAWFDGTNFHFVNATLEEKKFLAGNLGQNIGCAGNVVWPYRGVPLVFERGLAKGLDWLRERDYRGMIDLNAIVTRNQVYGLEWTSRFGYHASATLLNMLTTPWAEFFVQFPAAPAGGIVSEGKVDCDFAAAINISVPPFPCPKMKTAAGMPIEGVDPEQAWQETYLCDAMLEGDELTTAGIDGYIGCVLAKGHTFRGAWGNALEQVKKIKAPDLQWRNDLETSTGQRYRKLQEQGWI